MILQTAHSRRLAQLIRHGQREFHHHSFRVTATTMRRIAIRFCMRKAGDRYPWTTTDQSLAIAAEVLNRSPKPRPKYVRRLSHDAWHAQRLAQG